MNYDYSAYTSLAAFLFLVVPLWYGYRKAILFRVVRKTEYDSLIKEIQSLHQQVTKLQAGIVVRSDRGGQMKFEIETEEPKFWKSSPIRYGDGSWVQVWRITDHEKYMSGKLYVRRNKRARWVDEKLEGDVVLDWPYTWEKINDYATKRTARKNTRLSSRVR